MTIVFVQERQRLHLTRGCQPPRETTPGRLRHPAPVLMTGAPGPVPVYRAPKTKELRLWRPHNRVHELHLGISTGIMLNCNCGNSAVVCTSRPAPVVAPRRACPNPCRRTATAESPLLSAMLDQSTCVAQQRACQKRHAQQEHRPPENVLQLGNLCGLLKSRTMGICLCGTKGTSTTFT